MSAIAEPRKTLLSGAPGVVGVGVALVVAWRFTTWIQPWDALVLLRAGRAVLHGATPYPHNLTSPAVYGGHAFVYPYVSAWLIGPWAALPGHVGQLLYVGMSAGAVVASCWLSGSRSAVVYVCVLLSSTTLIALQIGSIEPLLLLGLVVAWRTRDQRVAGGLVLGVVIVAKVFLLPMVAWLVLTRRLRLSALTLAVVGMLLVGGWTLGPLGASGYFQMLGALARHESLHGSSLVGLLVHHGLRPAAASRSAMAMAAGVVIVGWILALRMRSEAVLFAACIAASLLASPVVWAHYFMLLAAPLLITRSPRAPFVAFFVANWLLVLPHHLVWNWLPPALPNGARIILLQLLIVAVLVYLAWRAWSARALYDGEFEHWLRPTVRHS